MKFLYRLKFVTRFNHRSKICVENVAEHSYFVSIMSLVVIDKFFPNVDKAKALQMALLHDVPEAITGDVLYSTKKSSPLIKKELDTFERQIMHEYFSPSISSIFEDFADDNSKEHDIVILADIMSILMYIQNEKSLGNENFSNIEKKTDMRLHEQCKKLGVEYDEIMKLITEGDIYND